MTTPPPDLPGAQHTPEDMHNDCRIELVGAVYTLASHYENASYALDHEARKAAEGDIAHARMVAARWNWNGRTTESPPLPDPAIEIAKKVSELMRDVDAYAFDYGHCGKLAKSRREVEKALTAALAAQAPQPAEQPLTEERIVDTWAACMSIVHFARTIEAEAFAAGWRTAAQWAARDDLISDIGSPAYLREAAAIGEKG
jgi:hypothetical protein